MAGVDTIIQQIRNDADAKAEEIIADAKKKAEVQKEAARHDADETVKAAKAQAGKESLDYEARIHSQIGMQRRQVLLLAKQEVIADVIDRAYEKIRAMEPDRYFGMLEKQIEKNAHAEAGEILLGETDLRRMPADFEKRADAAAKKNGGSLKLSKKPAAIRDGFLLRYSDEQGDGGIDENCTLEAILDEKKEELTDLVHRILWE
jgi:V/A-type H+-transporting ATPase subunit E